MNPRVTSNPDNTHLKVCYILLHLPVPSETFVINEIIALQSLGVDIHTVALGPSQACHEELMDRIQNPVYDLSDATLQQKASKSALYPAAFQLSECYKIPNILTLQSVLAAEYCKSLSIHHIHAHFATEAALVALLVSKLTGISFSFTAHAYDIFRLNVAGETYPDRRVKLLVENAAKTITISEFNRKYILAMTGHEFASYLNVVHCGIDIDKFEIVKRKATDSVTFLSVGRLFGKKGHEFLLRSFKKMCEACDVRLRIVGEGELLSELTALAHALCIADKVTFIGAISSDKVLKEMKDADVFVLHSITGSDGDKEGIPVSIMEACATGLPVVSTKHSGIPELVVEGVSGFLVDERDCDGFAEAMRILALSPELRSQMGLAGRSNVVEQFNLHHEAQKLKDIFTGIIEDPSVNSTKEYYRHVTVDMLSACRFNFKMLKSRSKNLIKRILQ